ncbi:ANTAR domain-containing protein [Streptomyces sp. NPDC001941]|uniref:ANTAR domain-containing protein n=1 Tax=Streptomyces sp. NPDC001941 TaxID=3154659 RepID=UPI003332DB94
MTAVLRRFDELWGPQIVGACADALEADGLAISLSVAEAPYAEPLWWTPGVAARFEDLQYTLGEGPGPEALRAGQHVLEPDLAGVLPSRWPALTPAAYKAGVRGACSYYLGTSAVRVGVMTVVTCRQHVFSLQHYLDALALVDRIITGLSRAAPQEMGLDTPDEDDTDLLWGPDADWPVVHQATGMVSAQLGLSLVDALARLRAYAYANDVLLIEVAQGVVARRIHIPGDEGNGRDWADEGEDDRLDP